MKSFNRCIEGSGAVEVVALMTLSEYSSFLSSEEAGIRQDLTGKCLSFLGSASTSTGYKALNWGQRSMQPDYRRKDWKQAGQAVANTLRLELVSTFD